MDHLVEALYAPALLKFGFVPEPENRRYGPNGLCWRQGGEQGDGYYWIYMERDLFDIKIHDFYFHEDSILEFQYPACLSITYYESISGEELSPYRRLEAGCVKTFLGGQAPYRVLVHSRIPITSIGIEITPAYYEKYLKERYPNEYVNPLEAFRAVDQTKAFPEMVRLLKEVRDYRGKGIAAKLFYEGKVAEAVSLVVARSQQLSVSPPLSSPEDRRQINLVTAYIDDHFALDLSLEQLSRIACMGATKLKTAFRACNGCTITAYIQQRRISQAEYLLAETTLSIGQVAQTVGYQNASRFAELFRKSTGYLPREYRKWTRKA